MKSLKGIPRVERPALRRRAILEAMRDLMVERDLQGIRVGDIAARAGVSNGTVYLYFEDKEHLLAALLEDLCDSLEKRLRQIPKRDPAVEALKEAVEVMLTFIDVNQDILTQFCRYKISSNNSLEDRILRTHLKVIVQCLNDLIKRGIKEKSLRSHECSHGVMFLLSLMRTPVLAQFLLRKKMPLEAQKSEIMEFYLNGVGHHD